MQIANQVFELSLEDAESIRRACGKKIKKDMEIWKPRIYEQAEKLGLGTDLADFLLGRLSCFSRLFVQFKPQCKLRISGSHYSIL